MPAAYGRLFRDWEMAVAAKVVGNYRKKWSCLRKYDFDFLLSGCLAHWHERRPTYRKGKGASRNTYMSRVLKHYLMDIIKKELADKRKTDCLSLSLDQLLNPAEPELTLLDKIAGDLIDAPNNALSIDLQGAFEKLTPLQRELCLLLSESVSKRDIASRLGRSRDTIYEEIKRIKKSSERTIYRNICK
jgi:DNA-directed RNA polymerase specialized sigma24 family protein